MQSEKLANQEQLNLRPENLPAVESLIDSQKAAEVWPEKIAKNPEFIEQVKEREKINQAVDAVFDKIPKPDMELEEAVEKGYVTTEEAQKFYDAMGSMLDSKEYKRLALYLPFEVLPQKGAGQSADNFRKSYMKAWRGLLTVHDVRANFVDGDVLETDKRKEELPRVVKAAHLIPKLAEKDLLTVKNAISLIEKSNDDVLRQSVADTLPVLFDMGKLSEKDLKEMEKSDDQLVRAMSKIIAASKSKEQNQENAKPTFLSIKNTLEKEFEKIESDDYADATDKRKKWLIEKKKQEAVQFCGSEIANAVGAGTFEDSEIKNFFIPEASPTSQQALANGIRKSIENATKTDKQKAGELYAKYKIVLHEILKSDNQNSQSETSKAFRRLKQLGFVSQQELDELGIVVPRLAGPFSENMPQMTDEISEIQKMSQTAELDPELSRYIFPVALGFGSKLKGYGEKKSDTDVAVFVKPGINPDARPYLQSMLKQNFHSGNVGQEIVEFWLNNNGQNLDIKNLPGNDPTLGEASWTHVLFGATWQGNQEAIQQLREKVLIPYFYNKDNRAAYLEEMERDALQYRLLHKGYEKFFPEYGGIHTEHSDEIDGESVFYDSGYRQLATRLFCQKVFLPKIK